ncbi:recombinase family protein [Flavobacterium sp. SORGH_AS_0622]|uniref:recombinase family protein n=1 Tax=Flavobacterium sp. SORGH_AS_0622 TaxID=3041772 RepID=UPI0027816D98|nr:recombinase family protein [Flavobacterium sp. SORGH_AS_0622]MDQ1165878.1 site-specific DNA recombinase [Flavobacterium sp. SORGH_AS_0622]
MINLAIYVRVSSLEQSYDRQISDITNYINRQYKDQEINIEIYNEKISGYSKTKKRPQLDKLVTKFRNDLSFYTCVYVTELSRLGRNPTETRVLVNELLENQIDICVTSSNGGTFFLTADRKINKIQLAAFQLMMEFADIEAETFKNRALSGKRDKVRQGGTAGGTYKPYGYVGINKKLVIDEVEAQVIKDIFNDYKSGLGCLAIANKLNDKKIPTKAESIGLMTGTLWDGKQVRRLLSNKLYYGVREYLKEKAELIEAYDSPDLAIINKELFDECTEIRLNKRGKGRNMHTKNVVLLQYLIKCGVCGRNYTHIISTSALVYCCSSRVTVTQKNCENIGVNLDALDSSIYDILCNTPTVLEFLSDTEQIKKDIQAKIIVLETSLPTLTAELAKLDNRIKRLVTDYYDGKIDHLPNFYENKSAEWETEKQNLTSQIYTQQKQLASSRKTLIDLAKPSTNRQILVDAKNDRNKLQSIFKQIIKSITVYKLSSSIARCDIKFQIAGNPVPHTLVVILNRKGIKESPKVFRYKTFLLKDFDPREQADEDYYTPDYYDDSKYKSITDWNTVNENKIILFES